MGPTDEQFREVRDAIDKSFGAVDFSRTDIIMEVYPVIVAQVCQAFRDDAERRAAVWAKSAASLRKIDNEAMGAICDDIDKAAKELRRLTDLMADEIRDAT